MPRQVAAGSAPFESLAAIGMQLSPKLMPSLKRYIQDLGSQFGFERLNVSGNEDYVDLRLMVLPEGRRSRGHGSRFMELVCAEADRQREVIGTCPEPLFSGWTDSDKKRLISWYERFGFVKNPDEDRYRVSYVRFPLCNEDCALAEET